MYVDSPIPRLWRAGHPCCLAALCWVLSLTSCGGGRPSAEPSAPVVEAPDSPPPAELVGTLYVRYGDPPAGVEGGTVDVMLVNEQGASIPVLVPAEVAGRLGGLAALHGKQAQVLADTVGLMTRPARVLSITFREQP